MKTDFEKISLSAIVGRLIAFCYAIVEGRNDISSKLDELLDDLKKLNQTDFKNSTAILKELMPGVFGIMTPAIKDFLMALATLFENIAENSAADSKKFDQAKNTAMDIFKKEFTQAANVAEQKASYPSVIATKPRVGMKPSQSEDHYNSIGRKIYFQGRNHEIEEFFIKKYNVPTEKLVAYLESCQQYEVMLESIFSPSLKVEKASANSNVLQEIHGYDIERFSIRIATSDKEVENWRGFITEYNISLQRSTKLMEALNDIHKVKREKIEQKVSKEIEMLEVKTDKTNLNAISFLQITEMMKSWSFQFFTDPEKCEKTLLSDLDTSHFSKNLAQSVTATNQKSEQEKQETTFFLPNNRMEEDSVMSPNKTLASRYRELATQFNALHTSCLTEMKEIEALLQLSGPGSDFEKYKLRAEMQEEDMKTLQETSRLPINKWHEWQKEMVTYLTSLNNQNPSGLWKSEESGASSVNKQDVKQGNSNAFK